MYLKKAFALLSFILISLTAYTQEVQIIEEVPVESLPDYSPPVIDTSSQRGKIWSAWVFNNYRLLEPMLSEKLKADSARLKHYMNFAYEREIKGKQAYFSGGYGRHEEFGGWYDISVHEKSTYSPISFEHFYEEDRTRQYTIRGIILHDSRTKETFGFPLFYDPIAKLRKQSWKKTPVQQVLPIQRKLVRKIKKAVQRGNMRPISLGKEYNRLSEFLLKANKPKQALRTSTLAIKYRAETDAYASHILALLALGRHDNLKEILHEANPYYLDQSLLKRIRRLHWLTKKAGVEYDIDESIDWRKIYGPN